MKTHYFLIGTLCGLALIPVVAFLIMGSGVLYFLIPPSLGPLALGYAAAFSAARFADQEIQPTFLKALGTTVGIFWFGIASACLANVLFAGELRHPPFGLASEIWSFAGKPAFWLATVGTPCAIALAMTQFLVSRQLRSRRSTEG